MPRSRCHLRVCDPQIFLLLPLLARPHRHAPILQTNPVDTSTLSVHESKLAPRAVKAAFDNKQLPDLENGNMVFMMSKSAYLYDEGDHNGPHLMFFTALKDGKDWGAGASGSPVVSGPYWFLSSKEPSQAKGLPPILVFAVEVAKWSDGTAAPMHQE